MAFWFRVQSREQTPQGNLGAQGPGFSSQSPERSSREVSQFRLDLGTGFFLVRWQEEKAGLEIESRVVELGEE